MGITCGIGSLLVGARSAGFKVLGNVEWRKYYHAKDEHGRNTFTENFPSAIFPDHLEDLEHSEIEWLMGADLAVGHPECFPGATNIYTSKGWKPIKTIRIGDKVLTHSGKLQPVVQTIMKEAVGSLVLHTDQGPGLQGSLFLTPDHPVRVGEVWVPARNVKVGTRIRVLSVKCKGCDERVPVWNGGKFCSVSCAVKRQWSSATPEQKVAMTRKAHDATRQRCADKTHQFYDPAVRSRLMKSIASKRKGRTWIERKMEWALKEVGLSPVSQHPIGKFFVDFALLDQKIAVECDGAYWHRDTEKDHQREELIRNEGWSVVRFREAEIHASLMECAQEVKRVAMNHSGEYQFMDVEIKRVIFREGQRKKKVYNLSVLDDNSYVAKGFVVKNCGNFSQLSGANKNRLEKVFDPADIPLFVDLVARLKPRYFVMDDLPRSFMAYPMEKYAEKLPEYDLFPEWVSNWGYGNVQKGRNRMFMLGALRTEKWAFRPGEAEHQKTVADEIGDLSKPSRRGNVPNHEPHDNLLDCFRALNMGKYRQKNTWDDVREYFKDKPGGYTLEYPRIDGSLVKRIGFLKGHWDGPSHVLTGGNAIMHHKRCEPYTIRERARIQGFPDEFAFFGTILNDKEEWNHDTNMHMVKQTGKAMPIQFAEYVSRQVHAKIKGEEFTASGRRVIPANEHVDQAKRWYCENVGYSDQKAACGECWLAQRCSIRTEKYGMEPLMRTQAVAPARAERSATEGRVSASAKARSLKKPSSDGSPAEDRRVRIKAILPVPLQASATEIEEF